MLFLNTHREGQLNIGLILGLCFIYCSVVDVAFNYLTPESIGSQINVYQDMHMQFIHELSRAVWNRQNNRFLEKAEFNI